MQAPNRTVYRCHPSRLCKASNQKTFVLQVYTQCLQLTHRTPTHCHLTCRRETLCGAFPTSTICSHFSSPSNPYPSTTFDHHSILLHTYPDLTPPMTEASSPPGKTTQEAGAQGNKQRKDPSYLYELPDDHMLFVGNLAPDLEDEIFHGWMIKAERAGWFSHLPCYLFLFRVSLPTRCLYPGTSFVF